MLFVQAQVKLSYLHRLFMLAGGFLLANLVFLIFLFLKTNPRCPCAQRAAANLNLKMKHN